MFDLEVVLTVQDLIRYKWWVVITTIVLWEIVRFAIKYFYKRWRASNTQEVTDESGPTEGGDRDGSV